MSSCARAALRITSGVAREIIPVEIHEVERIVDEAVDPAFAQVGL